MINKTRLTAWIAAGVSLLFGSASAPVLAADKTPNEMGRIPVLMYHSVGDELYGKVGSLSRRLGLNVSAPLFRKHLELMRKAGWYPVNMRDVLSARLNVPKGKTPVVITFDDARRSQFYYLKNGSIDPNCAVGILLAMNKKYPNDWPNRAVFYVLPESKYNPAPFGQKPYVGKKVKFLVEKGFEIGNHSTTHHNFSNMSAKQLAWEMDTCEKFFQKYVPGLKMDTVAIPYGAYPRNNSHLDVLLNGKKVAPNSTYDYKCLLMAWGGASYPPTDKRFDRKRILRIGSEPGNIENWISALTNRKQGLRPYISDGNAYTVTVPASMKKYMASNRIGNLQVVVVNDIPAKKPAKPIVNKTGAKKPIKSVNN